MRRGRWFSGCVLAALVVAVPGGAAAYVPYVDEYAFQPEFTYGVAVGAEFIGNNSDLDVCGRTDPAGTEHCQAITELAGGGAALFFGVRPWRHFGAQIAYDVFFHQGSDGDPYNLATLQSLRLDGRVFLLPESMIDPWVQVGGGLYLIGDEYGFAETGGGFQLGVGADVYLAPVLSIGISATYRGIYFGEFHISQADLPWAMDGGDVREGFVHGIAALVDLTIHSIY